MIRSALSRITALPAVLWILAGIGWLTGEAISARGFLGYSYTSNYISDLGVPEIGSFQGRPIDSPLHDVMNATFIGHGVLFAVAGVLVARTFWTDAHRAAVSIAVLAALHGIGITCVGLFHGSEASVANGTIVLHILGATVGIISANVVAIIAGVSSGKLGAPKAYRLASVVLGILGIVCLIMLQIDSSSTTLNIFPDGVWERASVYTVVAWELMTGVSVLVGIARRRAAVALA